MSKVVNLAKNTSYLTLALVIQKVISFTYFMLLARYVGPEALGQYYLAISLTTIFAIFIDLGLTNVITREIAKTPAQSERWLANILTLKIPLTIFSVLAVIILVQVLGYSSLVKQLAYIAIISMVLDSFSTTFFAVARGYHNLKYESIASVIFQVIVLVFGYGALLLGGGLIFAMLALALASIYNFIYSSWILVRRLGVKISFRYEPAFVKKIFNLAWPFALYAVFQRFYTYLDSVFLSVLADDTQVGLYQIAFKIIFALQFLPLAFTASLYPALSMYWQDNRQQLLITFERAINYLLIISLPVIIGVIALSAQVVQLFKSGYEGAQWPLIISISSLLFIFINFPIGSLLNACDYQKKNTLNMGIVALVSLGLNLLLIPRYQAVGASLTVLVTNALMTILGFWWVRRIIPYQFKKNLLMFAKLILSSAIMGLVVYWGQAYLNIFVITIIGGFVYLACLLAVRALRWADLDSVLRSLKI